MSDQRVNVLVLGGSPACSPIVQALSARSDVHVVTSIVGRDEEGHAPAEGDVRIGGFGDAQALVEFVRERRIELLIDAADPFSPDIHRQAAETALHTGVVRAVFEPPAYEEQDEDVWIRVDDWEEAADLLPGFATRAMLDVAQVEFAAFERVVHTWFLLRGPAAHGEEVRLARFERVPVRIGASVEQEQAILRQNDVQLVVTREPLAEPRMRLLLAARALGLPAVLLRRPPLPPSDVVSDVDEMLAWVEARLGGVARGNTG